MAAPSLLNSRTTEITTSSSSHVVNMPTTVNSGEKLVWLCVVSCQPSDAKQISSAPSGWTEKYYRFLPEQYGGSQLYCYTRTADGTEGGTTKTLTMGVRNAYGENFVMRYDSNADLSNIAFGTTSDFVYSNNPTAPSVTGVVDDRLLSVFAGTYNGEPGGSTPSGFTLIDKQSANSGVGPVLAAAHKAITSAGATGTSSWGTLTYNVSGSALHIRIPKGVSSQPLTPTGFVNSAAFGSPAISLKLTATGVTNSASYGSPKITLHLEPTGVAGSISFGAPSIDQFSHLLPTGLSSTVAFGGPLIGLRLTASGMDSSAAFGAATVEYNVSLSTTGLASLTAFGSASIAHTVGDTFTLTSVGSDDDAFGSPVVTNVFTISVAPAPDNDLFGSPTVAQVYFIRPTGFVYRGRGFGQPVVTGGVAPADPDPPAVATLQKYIPAPQPESNVSDREYVQTELQKVQQSISLLVEYLQGNA